MEERQPIVAKDCNQTVKGSVVADKGRMRATYLHGGSRLTLFPHLIHGQKGNSRRGWETTLPVKIRVIESNLRFFGVLVTPWAAKVC